MVLGGFGSIPGAIIGSMILGMTEAFANTYWPQWSSLFFYGTILLILIFRPQGLKGTRTREDVAA